MYLYNITGDIDFRTYHIPLTVRFWLFLSILIPSIVCTLLILIVLLSDRNLRHALNNHVIMVLLFTGLICEITVYPSMLDYQLHGEIRLKSPIFCTILTYIDMTSYFMQILLFAWASLERHILIFHDRWLRTRKQRFCLHYAPIMLIVVYCCIFYGTAYFFPPCENTFDYSSGSCAISCLHKLFELVIIEALANHIIPSFIIIMASIALLLRILRQKRRMRQAIQWRKQRKMTIQLLSISLLYLLSTFPSAVVGVLLLSGLPADSTVIVREYANFFTYYAILLFPFVVTFSVPEFKVKMKGMMRLGRQERRIAATTR